RGHNHPSHPENKLPRYYVLETFRLDVCRGWSGGAYELGESHYRNRSYDGTGPFSIHGCKAPESDWLAKLRPVLRPQQRAWEVALGRSCSGRSQIVER